jgi:DNA-directed RNA polymerase subunit RPC12/RpoP
MNQQTRTMLAAGGAVLAVLLAVYVVTTGVGSSSSEHEGDHLECADCGHQWLMASGEVADIRARAGDALKNMTCPECGKETGKQMLQCQCERWYLPKTNAGLEGMRCPHCGFDPNAGLNAEQ